MSWLGARLLQGMEAAAERSPAGEDLAWWESLWNQTESVRNGVAGNAAWWLILAACAGFAKFCNWNGKRRLWRLEEAKTLTIALATSQPIDTGTYARPVTGVGQVRALAHVVESLKKGYWKIPFTRIRLSEDEIGEDLGKDLILLGGPKNNRLTARLLEEPKLREIVEQSEQQLTFHKARSAGNRTLRPDDTRGVRTDYGLIVRMRNPFGSGKSSIVLLSGQHTFGTVAAAEYFTGSFFGWLWFNPFRWRKNCVAIVTCTVSDGVSTAPKLVDRYWW